jgi:regulator of RNase E activity RraA
MRVPELLGRRLRSVWRRLITGWLHVAVELCQPGDILVVAPRREAENICRKSTEREAKEVKVRARLKAGELGIDVYGMRERLAEKGLIYAPQGVVD